MYNPDIISYIKEFYDVELHSDHTRCGIVNCIDAGGAVIEDIPDMEVIDFYNNHKDKIDQEMGATEKWLMEN